MADKTQVEAMAVLGTTLGFARHMSGDAPEPRRGFGPCGLVQQRLEAYSWTPG